jgi:hypothetical protein
METNKLKAQDSEIGEAVGQATYVFHERTFHVQTLFDVRNRNMNIQHLLTYED